MRQLLDKERDFDVLSGAPLPAGAAPRHCGSRQLLKVPRASLAVPLALSCLQPYITKLQETHRAVVRRSVRPEGGARR